MKEQKKHRLKFNLFLEKLYQSDKALIIYKVREGYNIYTDFSKKIILSNKNISHFLNSFSKKKFKKETDLYIGFFGYEILCNLLNIKITDQKKLNFYKGIFYNKLEQLLAIIILYQISISVLAFRAKIRSLRRPHHNQLRVAIGARRLKGAAAISRTGIAVRSCVG